MHARSVHRKVCDTSPGFQGHFKYLENDTAIVTYVIYQNGVIFSDLEWPPNPDFEGTSLFDVEYLRNGTR